MKGITLRGLEVFEALAAQGSVAGAARATGLSQPAVSQQLKNLESALGVALIDHGRRPMRLTPAGIAYRARAETALSQLRLAQSEVSVMDLAELSALSIGMIDDFDNDLTPRLVSILAQSLTNCRFKLITAASHEIRQAIADKHLHMAVSGSTGEVLPGAVAYPLVRDPFVIVAPRGTLNAAPKDFKDLKNMPFLRYEREQLVAQLVDRYLAKIQLELPERFEMGAHLALIAMIARGVGWTITTPLGYMRAARFHAELDAFPLPHDPFARNIVLYAGTDWAGSVPEDLARTLRSLIQSQMIEPCLAQLPWLAGEFTLVSE